MDVTAVDELIARRDRAFGAGAQLFYETPLHLVRGEGVWVFDAEGRRYMDMYNNVPCVGHARAEVAQAIGRAQATLNTHNRYLHEGAIALAERLVGLHHGPKIESVVFTCSGTEAIEVALRMARFATGRRGIVATDATYHGNSELVGGLTRTEHPANPQLATFPFPQTYREPTDAAAYLAALEGAIAALEGGLAALILCPILANEGLPDVPAGFMAAAAERVRAAGGLIIADEVQAGYGRTGRWWGYELAGLTPDIVVTGKPMGAGVPLAAAAASRPLVEGFRAATRYFNTFASSPLQAAAGMAVLDVIEAEDLVGNAGRVGAALKAGLKARAGQADFIGDVRGSGLFIGIEMVADKADKAADRARAVTVVNALKDKGFLTSNAGAAGNVVKIRPPLVFSDANAAEFLAAWDEVIGAF
ncbi:MAG TPA: aminotransferase class III-fold pyridoxal phosphate-dependent enzyme [Caulobacteraceae bacterium]|nr:aminotransferase class III-fold pyridoxal phosphate-dependent enzyme [Caulobacteraceae bacterium]